MKKVILFVVLLTVLSVGQAFSQIPNELYYESYYQKNGSNVNGNIELVIRIYTNATVGQYLYEDLSKLFRNVPFLNSIEVSPC